MIKFEQKKIDNKPYYYAVENIKLGKKTKKIQVYVGKFIPKNINSTLDKLMAKEESLIEEYINVVHKDTYNINTKEFLLLEKARIALKYRFESLSKNELKKIWKHIAVKFIFESNALEGSRLSASEVDAIVRSKYIKKNLNRKEVIEVENSIKAFEYIRSGDFVLNQRSIIALHALITNNLDISIGYKKHKIIVNNKDTTSPGKVRGAMAELLEWYKREKGSMNPFMLAIHFHQRFEHIHPFEDGNGRTGRMILVWMLLGAGYKVILFKHSNRTAYFSALNKADEGMVNKLLRYSIKSYRDTVDYITKELRSS